LQSLTPLPDSLVAENCAALLQAIIEHVNIPSEWAREGANEMAVWCRQKLSGVVNGASLSGP
jgi:hypothetical protein